MAKKNLVYHLYPLSWGGIREMTMFLPRVKALGVNYVWLSPITRSPMTNHGYDVADYYAIDERFGTVGDFDEFVRVAHILGLKIIMDLVIDSTSVEHQWFLTSQSHYIWDNAMNNWQNLLDGGPAWQYDDRIKRYYLHMGHPCQADLNWFDGGVLNRALAESFKNVILYWLYQRDVDGFRVGAVQMLNKKLSRSQKSFQMDDILIGRNAITAIRELTNIYGKKVPFLMLDIIDFRGGALSYYAEETDVEYITVSSLKSSVVKGCSKELKKKIDKFSLNPKFMLDLESHDSPRFTSRSGLEGKAAMELMFSSRAQAICLNQGQELGLENPTPRELPVIDILKLDARAALQFERYHSSAESLWENSRANTRLPLPLDEYVRQEADESSTLNFTKNAIQKWKAD